jgi:hypothetical protein
MRFFVTAFTILISITTTAQEGWIRWEENKTLQWEDFAGKIDDSSKYDAECYAEVCYDYTFYGVDDFEFSVYANFNKNTSWSKKDKQLPELLKHEQFHFNIAQFFAMKLKQEFENFVYTENYEEEILQLFNQKKNEYELIQRQYDEDTNHSLNKEKQKEWEDFVALQLKNIKPVEQLVKNDEVKVEEAR